MNCGFCNEPMAFINTDVKNGLTGRWFCVNKDCPMFHSIADIINHYIKKEHGMEHTLIFTTEELKVMQYWFSMAHLGREINGFKDNDVDDSALIKIQDALYESK
ncbi:hypothetical protein [Paenibacillus chitinolyticus]